MMQVVCTRLLSRILSSVSLGPQGSHPSREHRLGAGFCSSEVTHTMHDYVVPDLVRSRALRRQGKLVSHDTIDAARSALIVIDMQNYFVAEGFPLEVPVAREIVPNINRLATAMRDVGGTVVWVQTTATGGMERWGNHHRYTLSAEGARVRLANLDEAAEGFKLYPALEPAPGDARVKKITYSAFIAGSSDLDASSATRHRDRVDRRNGNQRVLRVYLRATR